MFFLKKKEYKRKKKRRRKKNLSLFKKEKKRDTGRRFKNKGQLKLANLVNISCLPMAKLVLRRIIQ